MRYCLLLTLFVFPWLNHANEASQLFQEYKELSKKGWGSEEATTKLFAAVALEPGNETYRFEELRIRAGFIHRVPAEKLAAELNAQLERLNKFRADFPESKGRASEVLDCSVIGGPTPQLSLSQLAEIAPFCRKIRQIRYEEGQKKGLPYDLSDGINSLQELRNANFGASQMRNFSLYADYAEWLRGRYQYYMELLRHANEFMKKNPELQKEAEKSFGCSSLADVVFLNYKHEKDQFIIDYLQNIDEFLKLADESPSRRVKVDALTLKLMRETVKGPRSAEHATACLDRFFAELNELAPDIIKPDSNVPGSGRPLKLVFFSVNHFYGWWLQAPDLPEKQFAHFQAQTSKTIGWSEIAEMVQKKDLQGISEHPQVVRQHNYERICGKDNRIFTALIDLIMEEPRTGASLHKLPALSELQKKLFRELNADFDIKWKTYREIFKYKDELQLAAAAQNEDEVYLLLKQYSDRMWLGNPDKAKDGLLEVPLKADEFSRKSMSLDARRNPAFIATSEYFVVAGKEKLAVYNRPAKAWRIFDDVISEPVSSMAIAEGRLYLFCSGQEESASMTSLRLDGTDRKLHFGSARQTAQNILDGRLGELNYAFTISDTELIFLLSEPGKSTICRYRIDGDKFEEVVKTELMNGILWHQREKWYLNGFAHSGEGIYEVDLSTGQLTWLFSQFLYGLKEPGPKTRINGNTVISGPFQFKDGYLWSGYREPAAIKLDAPETSPLLLLPPTAYIIDNPDGGVQYFTLHRRIQIK